MSSLNFRTNSSIVFAFRPVFLLKTQMSRYEEENLPLLHPRHSRLRAINYVLRAKKKRRNGVKELNKLYFLPTSSLVGHYFPGLLYFLVFSIPVRNG